MGGAPEHNANGAVDMELRTKDARRFVPRPVNACAQCGDTIFMPEWSEHVDDCRIRHLWACQACGYAFETTVRFAPLGAT
jgi:ribosomal protein S27AE